MAGFPIRLRDLRHLWSSSLYGVTQTNWYSCVDGGNLVFSPRGLFEGWDTGCMHNTRPMYVRPLTDAERHALEDSLRSPDAFVLRRAQILLASAAGERVGQIAPRVGFSGQAVRK